ncbi:MAG: acetylglutamate kinase [Idiomarina sp.]|nr:acetylglutamate kinase [Idiomarina sp.]
MNKPSPLVIKLGGAALEQPKALERLFTDLHPVLEGRSWVLVHGGGNQVEQWLAQLGHTTRKRDGQRITELNHVPIIAAALAGSSNTELVALMQSIGITSVGLSLQDGGGLPLLRAESLGEVGAPDWPTIAECGLLCLVKTLLSHHYVPVISSLGAATNGQRLNVNADLAAAALAVGLSADLLLLSDIDAVMDAQHQPIHRISTLAAVDLMSTNAVQGGMRVKLAAAVRATELTRRQTAITNWQSPAHVIASLQDQSSGTIVHL